VLSAWDFILLGVETFLGSCWGRTWGVMATVELPHSSLVLNGNAAVRPAGI
jgi:hypothetical protein